jgi:hypothetical protein
MAGQSSSSSCAATAPAPVPPRAQRVFVAGPGAGSVGPRPTVQLGNTAGQATLGMLICRTSARLNSLPISDLPDWIVQPTYEQVRVHAAYRPDFGQGVPEEPDAGNKAGSMMMLALFEPEKYLLRGPPLRICGWPIPPVLLHESKRAENFRTNVLEGLLNHWQNAQEMTLLEIREMLLSQWVHMHNSLQARGWLSPSRRVSVEEMTELLRGVPPLLIGATARGVHGRVV